MEEQKTENSCIEYSLNGNECYLQVEPAAGYWFGCPILRTPTMQEVEDKIAELRADHPSDPEYDLDPFYCSDTDEERAELELLKMLEKDRYDQPALKKSHTGTYNQVSFSMTTKLSAFLEDVRFTENPPPGSTFNRRPKHQPFIKNGAELGRLFESEPPGYWHRHVLNVISDEQVSDKCDDPILREALSPPRKAMVLAALEVTNYSALMSAWHFKWVHGEEISRRRRPIEAHRNLSVLYDTKPGFVPAGQPNAGDIIDGDRRTSDGIISPGTPRHPAYPSGHSTYSKAASEVLGCLFPDYKKDFDLLAENIGHARLWAGVHWLSDHLAGKIIGRAVGQLIIEQLNRSGIKRIPTRLIDPPSLNTLRIEARQLRRKCNLGEEQFCEGIISKDQTDISIQSV